MKMLEIMESRGEVAVASREGRERNWDLAQRIWADDPADAPSLADARAERGRRLLAAIAAPRDDTDRQAMQALVDFHRQHVLGPVRRQRGHVLGHIAARQQAAVHLGVQGLDAAVQHFRKTRHFGHFGHGQALVGQQLGGATGGDQAHAQGVQLLGQIDDAGLVGDGNEGFHQKFS